MPKTQNRAQTKPVPQNGHSDGFIDIKCEGSRWVSLDELVPLQGELKTLSDADFQKGTKSLLKYGFTFPFFVWENKGQLMVLDGHQRDRILKKHRADGKKLPDKFPAVGITAKNEKEAKEKILLLTSQYGHYTMDSVYEFIQAGDLNFDELDEVLDFPAFDMAEFRDGYFSDENIPLPSVEEAHKTLQERFGVPPFSVLDARQGYWQERKRAWLALGIQSELGRGGNLQGLSESNDEYRYNKNEFLAKIGRGPKTERERESKNGDAQRSDAARRKVSPGGSPRPAANYGKSHARGDGKGRPI